MAINKIIKEKLLNNFNNKIDYRFSRKFILSGIKDIDNYLNGFNLGSIIGIGGNYSTGKTTLALQVALNYIKNNDKYCLYIDTEHSLTKEYLDNLQVDKEKFIYGEIDNLIEIQTVIEDSIKSNLFGIIIIDSITGVYNENLYNKIINFYNNISKLIVENNILMICIEQEDIQKYNNELIKSRYKKLLFYYSQYIGLYLNNANENYSSIELKTFKNENCFNFDTLNIKLDHKKGFII